jgi:hypothetical protein
VARSPFVGDSYFVDHVCIFGKPIARHNSKFLRRTTAHSKTQLLKLSANFTVAERLENLEIQPANDLVGVPAGASIATRS